MRMENFEFMRWPRLSRPALWSLLNNSGLDGRGLSVCWNPDCRCHLLPKSRRLPFSGFLPLDVSSPAVGDIFRSGRCRCVAELILQAFRHFTYVTAHSPTLPLLHLRHSLSSNTSFASLTSQDFHLRHLASRPCSMLALSTISEDARTMFMSG